ncbi:MAG TPA: transcriptional regulator [Clostridium sp.]|nr:transcriptional regulator [Clostridium sp.]
MNKDKVTNTKNKPKPKCPLIYAVDIIGGKWRLPILWYIYAKKTVRYGELKKSLESITNTVLIRCLKELEENNLIIRKQYTEVPPRVEYSLTERGKALLPTLNELSAWGEDQIKFNEENE